jgi:hypothetical protein
MSVLTNLLSNNGYIIVNKALIKKLGLECAILIGELCSEYSYWEKQRKLENGFFYSTRENISNNTGLSSYHQRNAINKLVKKGIVLEKYEGIPLKRWYSLNLDRLYEILK